LAKPTDLVAVAVIRQAHGVRGEVKIASLTEPRAHFLTCPLTDAAGTAIKLTKTGIQKDWFLCRIEGIQDRNAAELLKGRELYAPRSTLPALEENQSYVSDLIGLTVLDEKGQTVGTLLDIVNYGATDIAVIDTSDGELMLPYTHQFFPEDAKQGAISCRLPEIMVGEEVSPLPPGEGGERSEPVRASAVSPELTDRARKLRHDATDAEKKLWAILRNRQLSGIKFRRQYRVGGYILDFAAPEYKFAVELDGGQHNNEAHRQYDAKRSEHLRHQGWHVERFWNQDVMENAEGVARALTLALSQRERVKA